MPNPAGFGQFGFEQAVLAVEAALRTRLDAPWRRLEPGELASHYFSRHFARGWRIEMKFSDGTARAIDLLVGKGFPAGYPRTALVNGPGQLIWPHVEHDGVLCLLPIMAEVDAERPGDVAINLVARSARLIEELIDGAIIDRDFREEFLTYWAYAASSKIAVHSLVEARRPSRRIAVWRDEKMIVVAEDEASLGTWLNKRFGKRPGRKTRKIEAAALLWLAEPPLPAVYPEIGADLLGLAQDAGDGAVELLIDVAGRLPKDATVLIGAEGRGGPGLVATFATAHRKAHDRSGRIEAPLTKGFRAETIPQAIAAMRTYSAAPVIRANVQRADAGWIHGRGKDPRSATLLGKTVTIIGCGSVGASVAARLARAGVGIQHLVDYQEFEWPNLGRHELGAGSVGQKKALELAVRLQADFPHLTVIDHPVSVHALINGYESLLDESDVIVAATGSWDAESALNRWHVANGRRAPIVYGWTESHAAAGHAVTISGNGGCLRCGIGGTGRPLFHATEHGETATIEEPACGNHFTPYGAIELGFVVDLISRATLRALLETSAVSMHDLWLAPAEDVVASGGRWSAALEHDHPDATAGGRLLQRPWPTSCCTACGEDESEAAA